MQRDVEAGVRELERDHAADAARGARDQRHRPRRAGGRLFGVRVVGVAHDPYNLIRCSTIPVQVFRVPLTGSPTPPTTPGDALVTRIASRIAAAGGWMPFDDFMAEALYAPGLGYYSGGRRIFGLGPEGGSDFVTAPELSPFFGRALAVQVREALTASGTGRVYEFGAGTGALAEQLLEALDADDADDDGMLRVPVDYTIVELSAHLRERQQARLARFAPRVQWLDAWPETIEGVVVGNEVLDAMPVKLLHRDGGRWHERGVVDLHPRRRAPCPPGPAATGPAKPVRAPWTTGQRALRVRRPGRSRSRSKARPRPRRR